MARHRGIQGEWPTVKREPDSYFTVRDGYFRSDRQLGGPLRMGTTPEVGPRGDAINASETRKTDFGTDRVSPRHRRLDVDQEESKLLARDVRGGEVAAGARHGPGGKKGQAPGDTGFSGSATRKDAADLG